MEKKQLNYIASYDRPDPKTTWSGTTYSLYCALQKKADIRNIDVGINQLEWILDRVFSKTILRGDYRGLRGILEEYKKSKYHLENQNNLYLYGPYISKKEMHSWIYTDLTVGSLLYYKNFDRENFEKSTFEWIKESEFAKWNTKQLETFENIEGIFTMSCWLKDYLINVEKVPCKVVYAGGASNCIVKPNYSQKEHNKILFVGKDFERKGGPLVIEAFLKLREKRKDVELYILGGHVETTNCDGIHFIGEADRDTVIQYYNMCDVFCLPSHFEAYGVVFVEALLYGLPVIARDKFEMPYIIEDGITGRLMKDNDSSQLAVYMLELLENTSYAENVRAKYDFYYKNYSWDTVAERIIEQINKE